MTDPDYNPREPVDWAQSADPSDINEPNQTIRDNGYLENDILPSDEFNSLLHDLGEQVDSHDRTVGVYPDRQTFKSRAQTGDFGYIYDPNFGQPVVQAESNAINSGSSTETPVIDSNGKYAMIGYPNDNAFAIRTDDLSPIWEYSDPNKFGAGSTVAISSQFALLGHFYGGEATIEQYQVGDDDLVWLDFPEILDPNPPTFQINIEFRTPDTALAWLGGDDRLFEIVIDESGGIQSITQISTAPNNFSLDVRRCAIGDDYAFFTVDGGLEVYQYQFSTDTWTAMTGVSQTSSIAPPRTDYQSVYTGFDYDGTGLKTHRQRWNFDNFDNSLDVVFEDPIDDLSVNGDVVVGVTDQGRVLTYDRREGGQLPISVTNAGNMFGGEYNFSKVFAHADDMIVLEDTTSGYSIWKVPTAYRPRHVWYSPDSNEVVSLPS